MKKRGTLPLLILLPEVLEYLIYKNKQATPTPNMKCHQTEQSTKDALRAGYTYPIRAFTAFLFWIDWKFPSFRKPKQALINAFIICLQNRLLNFALQSYNKIYGYANFWLKKFIVERSYLAFARRITRIFHVRKAGIYPNVIRQAPAGLIDKELPPCQLDG